AGMLHGIYAFVAVAEFWLVRGDEAGATTGEFLLAHRRQQVAWALDSLAGEIDGITDHGAELVAAVRRRLAACLREPVDTELIAVADRMIVDHHAGWRLRNVRPDEAGVAALVNDWRHGRPADRPHPGTFTTRRPRAAQR